MSPWIHKIMIINVDRHWIHKEIVIINVDSGSQIHN